MTDNPSISLPLLDSVQVASPCSARWEEMAGDERSRHCGQCNLRVHNISGMTRGEAEAFLARSLNPDGRASGGRVCARFFRRADGTILTADCPVGLAAVRARARRTAARVAAALGLTSLIAWAAAHETRSASFANSQPLGTIAAWLKQPAAPPAIRMGKIAVMGEIAPASAPPAPSPIGSGAGQ